MNLEEVVTVVDGSILGHYCLTRFKLPRLLVVTQVVGEAVVQAAQYSR